MKRSSLLVALCVVLGCNRASSHLEVAKQKHADGALDAALTELTIVKATAAGTPDAATAAELATAWLIEAADKTAALDERRRRLDEALDWTPTSGAAGARRCRVLVLEGKDDEGATCLEAGMKGKTGAPEAILSEARAGLQNHKDQVDAQQRAALLAGGGKAQLELIVQKWPASAEAAAAQARLQKSASLCADSAAYLDDLKAALAAMEKLSGEDADAARKAPMEARLEQLEKSGKELDSRSHDLKNKGMEAEAHPVKPGEEKLQKTLHEGYWKLADLAAEAADDLKRPAAESEDSYEAHASATLTKLSRSLKGVGARLRKDLAASEGVCKGAP